MREYSARRQGQAGILIDKVICAGRPEAPQLLPPQLQI